MKLDIYELADEDRLYEMLPETVQTIADMIGVHNALTLVEHFGGVALDIPHSPNSTQAGKLAAVLGVAATQAIIDTYAGEKLYINNCHALRIALRNHAIIDAIVTKMEVGTSQHAAIQAIAPVFGVTERWVYQILKDMSAQDTPSLF